MRFSRTFNFFALTCLFLVGCAPIWFWIPKQYPITAVRVVGLHPHVTEAQLVEGISPYLTGGFFGMDVQALQKGLLEWPWLRTVSVRRVWPSTVVLSLSEHQPVARWNTEGVLDEEGAFIEAPLTQEEAALPLLEGPLVQHDWVWAQYERFNGLLAPLGLHIQQLSLAPWGSWRLVLDNGIEVILGKAEVEARLKNFLAAYRKLGSKQDRIASIDLRYTSGCAVGWKAKQEKLK